MESTQPRFSTNSLIRAALWGLTYWFLLAYLHPELLLSDSIVTGGDTAGHYYTAAYLRDYLLPRMKIMGWQPGHYAGFPLFQFYFPLPFLCMAGLSLLTPLTVAFKIVSVAGILSLPLGAYSLLRNLGCKDPAPDLGAVFSLAFLFMEANSAWGGNIPSNLAGEFTYGLGLTLALVYLGRLFRDADSGRNEISNALLLAAVGLCHGYPLLFCVIGASFFLTTPRNWFFRLFYILKVNILAFCFMGFWIVPLILFGPYTTAYNFVWIIKDWQEALPRILWPFAAPGLIGAFCSIVRPGEEETARRSAFFVLFLVFVAGIFYFAANKLGVVDIRFLPFGQLLLVLLGAAVAGLLLAGWRSRHVAALALALLTVAWTAHHESYIENWVIWNYSGYEGKSLWPAYRDLNGELKGDFAAPRVVYEHSAETRGVGTLRAFELLPMFAGRATLEGLYLQASLNGPFVFYIQSEVSQTISAPFSRYNYSRFDLEKALRHLELFNVGNYITVGEEARTAAVNTPGYELVRDFPPFALFRLPGNSGRYVVQPEFKPVLAVGRNPRTDAFTWFRWSDVQVPVVWADRASGAEAGQFAAVIEAADSGDLLKYPPRQPLSPTPGLRETIGNEEIIIEGAEPGRPLWIKVSYHPNWKVEGAERVWRASPAFMMVFPEQSRVRLYFGRTWPDYLGYVLTGLAVFYTGLLLLRRKVFAETGGRFRLEVLLEPAVRRIRPHGEAILAVIVLGVCAALAFVILAIHDQDPTVLYNKARKAYDRGDYETARRDFEEALRAFPLSPIVDHTLHHLALTWFRQDRYDEARSVWARFSSEYPESRLLPEALYHMGLCDLKLGRDESAKEYWRDLRSRFPKTNWAVEAGRRLAELGELPPVDYYGHAMSLFDNGRYEEARKYFLMAGDEAATLDEAQRAAYFAAVSLFKAGLWAESRRGVQDMLELDPTGGYNAEGHYHLGLIALYLNEEDEAVKQFRLVIDRYPHTRWRGEAEKQIAGLPGGRP